ncbi:hypothetical protein [uncultured Desulfuromusa sp.]|uniref:coiled-coil domain-containing protein n=1 Tax=uncultured Desulfuromusa sp. TaxID=219183 RepID=UPI002AA62D47|nr:hypothetical protein [uncultured Desulfuromusa sp.]
MNIETIFYTQIGSIVGFIIALFVLYRVLVSAKDAKIELLKEKILGLREALESQKETSPDILADRYSKRVKLLTEELERLAEDQSTNEAEIKTKENQLIEERQKLTELEAQMERAQELMSEYFCPYCKAPMEIRQFHSELVCYGGRELDVDHEFVVFECGLELADGRESRPCKNIEAT